ncbi:MAG: hypothetical protein ACE5DM_03075 [Candidatus Nanoarchaeia archaeon]
MRSFLYGSSIGDHAYGTATLAPHLSAELHPWNRQLLSLRCGKKYGFILDAPVGN